MNETTLAIDEWATRKSLCPNPNCGHPMGAHVLELGCTNGWVTDWQGTCVEEGCLCPLTLAQQHNPPRENEATR